MEGLGLPLLEAYGVGTPVCFRAASAMAEVLGQAPGAWDGKSDASFIEALDACLAMDRHEVERIQSELAKRFDWGRAVAETLDVYRRVIEQDREHGLLVRPD